MILQTLKNPQILGAEWDKVGFHKIHDIHMFSTAVVLSM